MLSTRPVETCFNNPADHGSRSVAAGKFAHTTWLFSPAFLRQPESTTPEKGPFELMNPESDVEIRLATTVSTSHLGSARFERFSRWTPLFKSVGHLRHISRSFIKSKDDTSCAGWHLCKTSLTDEALTQVKCTVVRCIQNEVYAEEIKCIMAKQDLPSNSSFTSFTQ